MTDKHVDERPTWNVILQWRYWKQALAAFFPPKLCVEQAELSGAALPTQLHSEREPLNAFDYIEIAARRDNLRPYILQSLPPECREVYLSYHEDELDVPQIAILLNISENRVEALWKKATIAVARGMAGRTEPSSNEPDR